MESIFIEMAKHSFVVAVMVGMFILILWLLYKINNNNIDTVKGDLMTSINTIKVEMIQNAKDIKVGVDKDVVALKAEQEHTFKQLEEVKYNIHTMNKNMVNMQHNVNTMNSTMADVNNTLTLMYVQLGGDLNQAIKGSIQKLKD